MSRAAFTCTLTRYFDLCSLPVRSQPPLMPYRRRITIRWQSGGGLAPSRLYRHGFWVAVRPAYGSRPSLFKFSCSLNECHQ